MSCERMSRTDERINVVTEVTRILWIFVRNGKKMNLF